MTVPDRDKTPARRSRFWLYAPFVALGLIAVAWSLFWFLARARSETALDEIMAREAGLGRRWTCQDRSIGGFPFRFEARCAGLSLKAARANGDLTVTSGPLVVVAQIYNPRHVILEATSPATVTQSDGTVTRLRWKALEASLILAGLDLDRLSAVVAEPEIDEPNPTPAAAASRPIYRAASLEMHGRRNPSRPVAEGVVDLSVVTKGAAVPVLDALAGNSTLADIELNASLTRALMFRTGVKPDNLDLWRDAGGRLELARFGIAKGNARFEAKGEVGLDPLRRLTGRLEPSAAGIDRIAGFPIGNLGNLGGLLTGRAPPPPSGAGPALKPLPTIEFRDGRVQAGPLRIPNLQLPPLY